MSWELHVQWCLQTLTSSTVYQGRYLLNKWRYIAVIDKVTAVWSFLHRSGQAVPEWFLAPTCVCRYVGQVNHLPAGRVNLQSLMSSSAETKYEWTVLTGILYITYTLYIYIYIYIYICVCVKTNYIFNMTLFSNKKLPFPNIFAGEYDCGHVTWQSRDKYLRWLQEIGRG